MTGSMGGGMSQQSAVDPAPVHVFEFFGKKMLFEANSFYLFDITNLKLSSTNDKRGGEDPDGAAELYGEACKFSHILASVDAEMRMERKKKFSSLWLNLAHNCNLKCVYCFAKGGSYGRNAALMEADVARRAVDFLIKSASKDAGLACCIYFFGGEPLLNSSTLRSCTIYAEEKAKEFGISMNFHLVTNGTLLTEELIQFLIDHKVIIQLSLDGPREINDKLRRYPDGESSYECVYSKLLMLKQMDVRNLPVRATITHHNCEIKEMARFFSEMGFTDSNLVPVMCSSDTDYSLTEGDIEVIRDQCSRKADEIINSIRTCHKTDLEWFSSYVCRLYNRQKKRYFCDAGFQSLTVTPEGKLYVCHRLVSEDDLHMGDVFEGMSAIPEQISSWGSLSVDDRPSCRSCWAKYFCGGGCAANSFFMYGDLSKNDEKYCRIIKAVAENALRIYSFLTTLPKENISIENRKKSSCVIPTSVP